MNTKLTLDELKVESFIINGRDIGGSVNRDEDQHSIPITNIPGPCNLMYDQVK